MTLLFHSYFHVFYVFDVRKFFFSWRFGRVRRVCVFFKRFSFERFYCVCALQELVRLQSMMEDERDLLSFALANIFFAYDREQEGKVLLRCVLVVCVVFDLCTWRMMCVSLFRPLRHNSQPNPGSACVSSLRVLAFDTSLRISHR